MSRNLVRIALLLLGCVAMFNQAVYARSCEEKSENLARLGDDYFKLGEQDIISVKNKQIIAIFYEKIQGEWTGHRVLTECVDANPDNDNALSQSYKNARTNLSITVDSSGGVNMQSSLYYDGSLHESNDVLFSGEITDAKVIGDESLVYAEKYRQKIKAKKSLLRESVGQLTVKNNTCVIKISNYTNGYFVSEELWTLKLGQARHW